MTIEHATTTAERSPAMRSLRAARDYCTRTGYRGVVIVTFDRAGTPHVTPAPAETRRTEPRPAAGAVRPQTTARRSTPGERARRMADLERTIARDTLPPAKFREWRLEQVERDIRRHDDALYFAEAQKRGGPLLRVAR